MNRRSDTANSIEYANAQSCQTQLRGRHTETEMYLQFLVLLPLLATGMAAPSMNGARVQARDTAPSIELSYAAGLEVKDFRQLIRYAGKEDHPTPLDGIIPKDGRVTMPGLSVVENKAGRGTRIKVIFSVEGTQGISEVRILFASMTIT